MRKGRLYIRASLMGIRIFTVMARDCSRRISSETKSWEEILEKLQQFGSENPEGWIIGRGWDQNDWTDKEFPDNIKLNELFPNRPVILFRIDKGMQRSQIKLRLTLPD